jgi:hypothetical protein
VLGRLLGCQGRAAARGAGCRAGAVRRRAAVLLAPAAAPDTPGPAWPPDAEVRAYPASGGADLSATPYERPRPSETVAGFLAAASIFVSLTGIAYRPLRLIPIALLLALIATGIGGRASRLAAWAVGIGAAAFAVGMAVAVITSNPLW